MKLDDEVKMISAEAPIIFAKAAELFIQELTLRAWVHTEENKRRTLQVGDVRSRWFGDMARNYFIFMEFFREMIVRWLYPNMTSSTF